MRPFSVSASKSKQQIQTVNDALMDLVEARLNDVDFGEVVDEIFRSRRLLNRLILAAKSLRQR